jgi:hypothetical protein
MVGVGQCIVCGNGDESQDNTKGEARISRRIGRFDGSGVRIDVMHSLVSCAMRRSDGNS